jgi:hypothetical protein
MENHGLYWTDMGKDEGSMFLRNVGIYLQVHMELQPRGRTSIQTKSDLLFHTSSTKFRRNSLNNFGRRIKIIQLCIYCIVLCKKKRPYKLTSRTFSRSGSKLFILY